MEALIREKLSRLKEYLRFLRELKAASKEAFMADFRSRGAAERYLQLAIESVIDIGSEIISFLQLGKPERYRDIPPMLAQAGVIPPELSEKITKMIGFRNLLVHDYAAVDMSLEYEFLQTRLSDFEAYMAHIAEWLKGRSASVQGSARRRSKSSHA